MITFSKDYFETERQSGFIVPAEIKKVWAVQLLMYDTIRTVLEDNDLQYWAILGTLLGARRHHGYIPWDDDFDICMKRKDYDKFIDLALNHNILPPEYRLINIHTHNNYTELLTRIVNASSIEESSSKEHMEKYFDCPYVIGIDIFPIDFFPKTEKEFKCVAEIISSMNSISKVLKNYDVKYFEDHLKLIEMACKKEIDRSGNIAYQLNCMIEDIARKYDETTSDKLGFFALQKALPHKFEFDKECFTGYKLTRFENTNIRIPYHSDRILRNMYDKWKIRRRYVTHEYPYIGKQKPMLENITPRES